MKLLSDFDGVWTHPRDEARAQCEWMDATLAGWLPSAERERGAAWIRRARAATLAEPTRYGWAPGGRLTAFADEDPFAPHSALLHYLHVHRADDATAAALCEAITSHGFDGLEAFGGAAHAEGVRRAVAERGPGILPGEAAAGRQLLDAGVDVVVVSNSGTDKLVTWFAAAGVPNRVHPDHAPGALRLRGAARKFVLGEPAREPLAVGGVAVDVARPHYEAILRDERPDAVVGDVFSLDLALPLALRRRESAFRGLRLFWVIRDYTPSWLRDVVAREAPEVEAVANGLKDVAALLAAGARRD
jgi:hypothetical protein